MLGKSWTLIVGLLFIAGGLSGQMVLRGTNSTTALVAVGGVLALWGIIRMVMAGREKGGLSGSAVDAPRTAVGQRERQPQGTLSGHETSVNDCAFLPDGQTVVTAGDDKTLKLWDVASGTVRATLTGHTEAIGRVAVCSGGHLVASSGFDKTLRIWDVGTGTVRVTLAGHTGKVWGCAFSPDGRTVVLNRTEFVGGSNS